MKNKDLIMNESVIRSPKWLRNFVDFEINTKDDIKGEPSKKMKKKMEEEQRIKDEQEKARLKEERRKQEEERKRQEEEKSNRDKQLFSELFDLVIRYIEKNYKDCNIDVPEKNKLIVNDDGLTYKQKELEFKITMDNTIRMPSFEVYIRYGNEKFNYTVSGLNYANFKLFLLNYVYEYMKTQEYLKKEKERKEKKNQSQSSGKSSYDDEYDYYRHKDDRRYGQSSTKSDDDRFDEYFKNKYKFSVNDFGKKTSTNKFDDSDEIKNKRRRYNLLKDTLIGYERELFKILDWEKKNPGKTHDEKNRVMNEISNLNRRMEQVNTKFKFEGLKYKFTHLKRFDS